MVFGIKFKFKFKLSPLCFGLKKNEADEVLEFGVASESIALEALGITRERFTQFIL